MAAPRRCPACKDQMPDPPNRNIAIERIVDREGNLRYHHCTEVNRMLIDTSSMNDI